MWYKLDENNNPIKTSIQEYCEWIEDNPLKKVVAQDTISEIFISTVFLGLDHAIGGFDEPTLRLPILWETMIFRGEHDQYTERYISHEDALQGHKYAVELVKRSLKRNT